MTATKPSPSPTQPPSAASKTAGSTLSKPDEEFGCV
jgi:hypothetical protein